jgi:hypothetical protein
VAEEQVVVEEEVAEASKEMGKNISTTIIVNVTRMMRKTKTVISRKAKDQIDHQEKKDHTTRSLKISKERRNNIRTRMSNLQKRHTKLSQLNNRILLLLTNLKLKSSLMAGEMVLFSDQ